MCFRYKGLKTDEKRANYEEMAKTVPRLSENDGFGPWWNILDEKVKVDPWKFTVVIFSPWNESLKNLQIGPSRLQSCQKWPPGIIL